MRGIVPNLSIGFRDSRCLCSGARAPGSWAEGLGQDVLGTAEGMGKLPNREEDGPAWEGHLGWALDSGGAASALSPPIGGGSQPHGCQGAASHALAEDDGPGTPRASQWALRVCLHTGRFPPGLT